MAKLKIPSEANTAAWFFLAPALTLIGVFFFLPVAAGLWIWETTWPMLLRLLLIAGIAGRNLLVFLPRALQAPHP